MTFQRLGSCWVTMTTTNRRRVKGCLKWSTLCLLKWQLTCIVSLRASYWVSMIGYQSSQCIPNDLKWSYMDSKSPKSGREGARTGTKSTLFWRLLGTENHKHKLVQKQVYPGEKTLHTSRGALFPMPVGFFKHRYFGSNFGVYRRLYFSYMRSWIILHYPVSLPWDPG